MKFPDRIAGGGSLPSSEHRPVLCRAGAFVSAASGPELRWSCGGVDRRAPHGRFFFFLFHLEVRFDCSLFSSGLDRGHRIARDRLSWSVDRCDWIDYGWESLPRFE